MTPFTLLTFEAFSEPAITDWGVCRHRFAQGDLLNVVCTGPRNSSDLRHSEFSNGPHVGSCPNKEYRFMPSARSTVEQADGSRHLEVKKSSQQTVVMRRKSRAMLGLSRPFATCMGGARCLPGQEGCGDVTHLHAASPSRARSMDLFLVLKVEFAR